jgi:hypothetical protein
MWLRKIVAFVGVSIGLFISIAALVAPVLMDAHHWWPRKRKKI